MSDAHGNGPAFDKAIDVLHARGAREFRFLGDAVGYIPGVGVLDRLQSLGTRVKCLLGNHEDMLLRKVDAPGEEVYQHSRTRAALKSRHITQIRGWTDTLTETLDKSNTLCVHGSPRDPLMGYVYPNSDFEALETAAEFVFLGHTHRPFIAHRGKTCFVNVGSCGLPRDDGRFGSVGLFDPTSGHVEILRFDITTETEEALATAGEVHESVHAVYARRSAAVFGTFA